MKELLGATPLPVGAITRSRADGGSFRRSHAQHFEPCLPTVRVADWDRVGAGGLCFDGDGGPSGPLDGPPFRGEPNSLRVADWSDRCAGWAGARPPGRSSRNDRTRIAGRRLYDRADDAGGGGSTGNNPVAGGAIGCRSDVPVATGHAHVGARRRGGRRSSGLSSGGPNTRDHDER